MNQSARQDEILRRLQLRRLCSVSELSESFGVSEETIRRDIRHMEESGVAVKVHGGVRLPEQIYETPFITRMKERAEDKRLIASAVEKLIPDGASLFIDSGTTSAWCARALCAKQSLTVLTNSVEVARDMNAPGNTRIFFAGGELNMDYNATFGPSTNDYVSQFQTDFAILSIGAIHSQTGLFDFHMGESEIKRNALQRTSKVIIVSDGEKYERPGLIKTAEFEDVDILVTNQQPPADLLAAMASTQIIVAEADQPIAAIA